MGYIYTHKWNPRTKTFNYKKVFRGNSSPLLDFYDWEITWREVFFSLLIAGILTALGLWISTYVEKSAQDSVLKYRQAAQIVEPTHFKHAMKTDVGLAFVEGDFKTLDPISHPKLDGKHLSIVADHQRYTMHTRVVHYTTGTGKNIRHHSRIEHYWTWDTVNVERINAQQVEFCGSKFGYGQFSYDQVYCDSKTIGDGFNKRIVFHYKPITFHATIVSELCSNDIHNRPQLWCGKDIAYVYDWTTTTHAVAIFWVCWVILIIAAIFGFFYIDNHWLED